MDVDVFLIIIIIVFTALSLLVGLYFVIMFEHPEDKKTSWFYKIIVILALGVSAMNVLILPLDSINRSSGNTIEIEIMCWVFTIVSIVLAFVIIPFSVMYYESKDDESVKRPLCRSILCVIPFLLFFVILFLILWFAVGRCDIPITVLSSIPTETEIDFQKGCDNCLTMDTMWHITPSVLVYIVSLIGFVGYLLLIILGGCGLITLPFNLIQSFVNRPKPITLELYTKMTKSLNRWSEELLSTGATLKDMVRAKGRNHRSVRKPLMKYEIQVDALEKAYSKVQVCYKLRGGNPVWYWVQLFLGIIGIIISIVWIIHIIIYYQTHVHPFLNDFLDILDRAFPYAAILFFGIFVYYLYWCVLDGTASVGINLLIIRLHPMEKHNTPMTSILFNSGVMLFASFGVALFATMNFSIYQRLTALDMIYGTQMQNLAGLRYVWQYGTYVMFAFILIALIWKLVTLKKKDHKVDDIRESFAAYDTAGILGKESSNKAILDEDLTPLDKE